MSKFVDQMSITDENGNIKKEININFGDPLAREQSQKAMQTSEQAKQTAIEAKQIAQEAKDAVPGEVSQQVGEVLQQVGEKAVDATGVKKGSIQWTNNDRLNRYIYGCKINYLEGDPECSIEYASYLGVHLYMAGDRFKLYPGYNHLSRNTGTDIELWFDYIGMDLVGETFRFQEVCRTGNLPNLKVVENSDNLKNLHSTVDYNTSLILSTMQIAVETSENSLIYKNVGSNKIIVSNETLSENPSRFTNDYTVEDILKIDCTGVSDLSRVFVGEVYNEHRDRPLRTIVISNMTPTNVNGMFSLTNLKKVLILGGDFSRLFNMIKMFFVSGLESVDLSGLSLPKIQDTEDMFYGCNYLISVKLPDDFGVSANSVAINEMFSSCSVKKIDLSNCSFKVRGNCYYAFANCTQLEELLLGEIDFGSFNPTFFYTFSDCILLSKFSGLHNAKNSYRLNYSPLLTHESALNCIAGLYDLTEGGTVTEYAAQTLTFHPDVTAQLTEEEIAEATAKGWNIA